MACTKQSNLDTPDSLVTPLFLSLGPVISLEFYDWVKSRRVRWEWKFEYAFDGHTKGVNEENRTSEKDMKWKIQIAKFLHPE